MKGHPRGIPVTIRGMSSHFRVSSSGQKGDKNKHLLSAVFDNEPVPVKHLAQHLVYNLVASTKQVVALLKVIGLGEASNSPDWGAF